MKPARHCLLFALSFLACACAFRGAFAASGPDWPQLGFTQVASGLSFPTDISHSGDGSGRLFVCEQRGRVMLVASNANTNKVFLDLQDRVDFAPGGQNGLLGVAFPADYTANGCFYACYNESEMEALRLSRFRVTLDPDAADAASEQVLLEIPARGAYLNGGQIAFGPDGFLYLGVGDQGFSQYGTNSAQDTGSLRGKILRLDVSTCTNGYAVPANNPFVGRAGYLPEIWAMGIRNPFRFSFDRAIGDFFTCDVGQNTWEEIDFNPANAAGGQNYGWPIKEGNHDYAVQLPYDPATLTPPIAEYVHVAQSAVVGGYVYRGPSMARLDGVYFLGDFITGQIRALKKQGVNWLSQAISQTPYFISTFGEDDSGRLYLASYLSGKIYRIDDTGQLAPVTFSPAAGVSPTDAIALSTISPNATIHYTTDGTDPTEASPGVSSGGMITVVDATTVKAQAFRADLLPSLVSSATFTLRVATPAFTPGQGPITNGTQIAIQCSTAGAIVRYTVDGNEPGAGSALYSGPVPITTSTVLKARGFKAGFADSLTASFPQTPLQIHTVVLSDLGDYFSLNWLSVTGKTYQVQFSDDFAQWYATGKPLAGNGQILSYTNSAQYPLPLRRYLRLLSQDL